MNAHELQILRDTAWDSGWNAAFECAAGILESRILRADVTLPELAVELRNMKVGLAIAPTTPCSGVSSNQPKEK